MGRAYPTIGTDGTIYIGGYDGYLYAITPSGDLKWTFETGDSIPASVAIGADDTIYIASKDGYLYAISPTGSGNRTDYKWRTYIDNSGRSSPTIGADGTIYVGSSDYNLYALSGSPGWTYAAYQRSMSVYANSPWPKFQHNNLNLGRELTLQPKSLPIDRILKILEKNKNKE